MNPETVLFALVLFLGALAAVLSHLPVGECDQCVHCALVKVQRSSREQAARDAVLRRFRRNR